ncbi:hypothetical protein [Gilliamella apicola]|uniref:hypothetical protein n=1 Tax=Gilliamella apicola TaxID=1196095 RepID=UPI002FEDFC7B
MSNLFLDEILSLYRFNQYYGSPSEYFYSSGLIIDWAEKQVMQGDDSEILLIIASLGLDKKIDSDEVMTYLKRYLSEKNISIPSINYSCLVFMRLFSQKIMICNSLKDIGDLLHSFVFKYIEFGNRYFHRIKHYWLFIYYDYFDMYDGLNCYCAEKQLSEAKRYTRIKALAKRFYAFLNNKEMVEYLAKHI